jgi:hypothetical protein
MRTIGASGVEGHFGYSVYCPGCDCAHGVWIAKIPGRNNPVWQFSGTEECPTFSPSLLVRSGHFLYGTEHLPGKKPGDPCWCTWNAAHPVWDQAPFVCTVCHSFIRGGFWEYLSDCTHHLANQRVALPLFP